MASRTTYRDQALGQALGLLAARYGVHFEPAFDGGGAYETPQGFAFELPSVDDLESLMSDWRDELLDLGCYVFLVHATADERYRCGLVATADQFEAVRLVGTEDVAGGLTNDDVVAWLERLHEDHPFALTGIAPDTLQGIFLDPVDDPEEVVERVRSIAPETEYVALDEPDELLEMVRDEQVFLLWWG